MLTWSTVRVAEGDEVYTDHVSHDGAFRIERGYGRPDATGTHVGWCLLARDERGRMRWAEDASSVADGKRRAELRSRATVESNAA